MYKYENAPDFAKALLAVSINMGTLIGCYVFSYLIGISGRAPIFRSTVLITTFGGCLVSFFPNYYCLLIGLFIIGLGMGGDMAIASTVFMEAIPPSEIQSLTLLNLAWSLGTAISLIIAIVLEMFWTYEMPA